MGARHCQRAWEEGNRLSFPSHLNSLSVSSPCASSAIIDPFYATAVFHPHRPHCRSIVFPIDWAHIVNSSVWHQNCISSSGQICDFWFSQVWRNHSAFHHQRPQSLFFPSLSQWVLDCWVQLWPHNSKGRGLHCCNFNLVSQLVEQLHTGPLPVQVSVPLTILYALPTPHNWGTLWFSPRNEMSLKASAGCSL